MTKQELIKVGFRASGEWVLDTAEISVKLLPGETNNFLHTKALYAFIHDEKILYIGKTTLSVKNRFRGYANPGSSQSTNQKVNAAIRSLLEGKKRVEILIFFTKEQLLWNGIPVNLAAGLEDGLIQLAQTKLNKIGNKTATETEALEDWVTDDDAYFADGGRTTFDVVVTKARLTYGYIPIPTGFAEDLQIGHSVQVSTEGSVEQLAYNIGFSGANRQRRFGGKKQAHLIGERAAEGDIIRVKFLKDNLIKLSFPKV